MFGLIVTDVGLADIAKSGVGGRLTETVLFEVAVSAGELLSDTVNVTVNVPAVEYT